MVSTDNLNTVLTKSARPTLNNQAIVVQDEFLNTYQKANHDFLEN